VRTKVRKNNKRQDFGEAMTGEVLRRKGAKEDGKFGKKVQKKMEERKKNNEIENGNA